MGSRCDEFLFQSVYFCCYFRNILRASPCIEVSTDTLMRKLNWTELTANWEPALSDVLLGSFPACTLWWPKVVIGTTELYIDVLIDTKKLNLKLNWTELYWQRTLWLLHFWKSRVECPNKKAAIAWCLRIPLGSSGWPLGAFTTHYYIPENMSVSREILWYIYLSTATFLALYLELGVYVQFRNCSLTRPLLNNILRSFFCFCLWYPKYISSIDFHYWNSSLNVLFLFIF